MSKLRRYKTDYAVPEETHHKCWTTRRYRPGLLILLCILLIGGGCANTFWCEYVGEDKQPSLYTLFGGYNIELSVMTEHYHSDKVGDRYSVFIISHYTQKIEDSLAIDSIPVLIVDSLNILLLKSGVILYPRRAAFYAHHFDPFIARVIDERLSGPSLNLKAIIPKDEKEIKVKYLAILYDRNSRVELERKWIEQKMTRLDRKKFYID